MGEILLKARGATKRFGALVAVNAFDLHVEAGEVVGLIGPNGSGKSTFVNLVSGALSFDAGALHLGDDEATRWSQQKRCHWGLARTRQIARPLGQMSVRENVIVGALFGAEKFQSYLAAQKIADRVLGELGLRELASAFPTELPIQKLKILEIARALATEPRVLLLDESMAGLGSGEARAILDVIAEKRRGGMAILLIEHRLPELMSVSDRVVVLNAGALLAEGDPETVVSDPEVMRVYLGIDATANTPKAPAEAGLRA